MRKALLALGAILVSALSVTSASAYQLRCGYNVRCPQPQVQVIQQQRTVSHRYVTGYRTVTVRRPIYRTVRHTVIVTAPVVRQQVEAPCPDPVVRQPVCNSCGQQNTVARIDVANAPVNPAFIGAPTGNSCDPNNPRPYQRDGKWFICRPN